ncbi:hypothetical protein M3Y97_00177900 [Aphelenchoides bicaudatus]|nr:hypothetical protein M3Y97_00177900 [Aphelenchoides bicaudatus]
MVRAFCIFNMLSQREPVAVNPVEMIQDHKYKSYRLHNKVALITAGTLGIGLSTAERLASEGACVVVSSRKQQNVDQAVQHLIKMGIAEERVAGLTCHVASKADRRRLVHFTLERFGRIDILFHNAGVNCAIGSILKTTEQQFDKILDVNIKAAFETVRDVAPHMIKQGSGSIIFNSTIAAYLTSNGISTYGSIKAGLISLTKALSAELAPLGIRVNCLAPASIRTRMGRILFDKSHKLNCKVKQTERAMLDRIGEPEEVAGAVAYFASDDSSFISGETHLIDGGSCVRL